MGGSGSGRKWGRVLMGAGVVGRGSNRQGSWSIRQGKQWVVGTISMGAIGSRSGRQQGAGVGGGKTAEEGGRIGRNR